MTQLKINPEFKDLIPPLAGEELEGLTQSLISQGCRDAIKVWKNTIIDGHNRYAICQKHNIPYKVAEMRFASKKDAELWIVENQLGRRNLTNAMRIKLAMRKVDMLRQQARQNRSQAGCEPIHVRKTIAAEAKVSERTVQRYMKIIEIGGPELAAQVEKGEKTIGAAHRILEVRTVEDLCSNGPIPDKNADDNPFIPIAVASSLAWIEKVYKFMLSQPWFESDREETASIKKLLHGQRKVVTAISDKCP